MPASRSVVSVLLRELGDLSSHPQGRPCGRPPPAAVLAGSDAAVTGRWPHPPAEGEPKQSGGGQDWPGWTAGHSRQASAAS